ncbi:MAG: glycosyltransferase family 2 protein [Candidatus Kerfeldbacteria bacterium]|nr:glycosyltransferase family 2 protein [Candidatus Kerfeldbacteria bacterium]
MYSVVVPIYNEAATLEELHRRLVTVMEQLQQPFELIFVNDGSTDTTHRVLEQLSPITVVTLRHNFGQTAALAAGIKQAKGDSIITLDADLQNPPEEIPKLLRVLRDQSLDVVSGWRRQRHDSLSKHLLSRGANVLRRLIIHDGIHDSGCTLKAYRRICFEQLDLLGEIHRFIPGMLRWQGFTVGEVEVRHEQRRFGNTKYNTWRIVKGLIDMIGVWFWRKYSSRPLHLFGGSGILLTIIGLVGFVSLGIARIFFSYPLSQSIWPLLASLAMVSGIQLFVSGLLAEILIKQYYHSNRTAYSIKSVEQH